MANLLAELSALAALGANPSQRLAAIAVDDIQKATRFASAASAIVCERVGCNPPTVEEVVARLRD
jgi:fructokinase